jgi:diguanylate cyclase (GGDEF)-like protein
LTGLLDRWGWDALAPAVLAHVLQRDQTAALLIVDVDCFKGVNDEFGHPAGDLVLRAVSSVLQASTRGADLVSRYGGDEFLVLLPGATSAGAMTVAHRIRERMKGVTIDARTAPGAVGATITGQTVSIGIAVSQPSDRNPRLLEELLLGADAALRAVKRNGRDGIRIVDQDLELALGRRTCRYDETASGRHDHVSEASPPVTELANGASALLNEVGSALTTAAEHLLAPLGLTAQQAALLLYAAGQVSNANELAELFDTDTAETTSMLDRLRDMGLLLVARRSEDRRPIVIKLTAHGRSVVPTLPPILDSISAQAFTGFSTTEITQLTGMLHRMLGNLEAASCESISAVHTE